MGVPKRLTTLLPVAILAVACTSPAQQDRDESLPFDTKDVEQVTDDQ